MIYELSFWLKIEADAEQLYERIVGVIKKHGGELVLQLTPKKRRLAYPLDQQTLGYFCAIYFRVDKSNLLSIETELRANKQILRFILLKRRAKAVFKDKEREERRARFRAETASGLTEASESQEENLVAAAETTISNESQ